MARVSNKEFYSKSILKHGFTSKGMAWLSLHNQEVRFKTLLSLIDEPLSELSLVDAGCGVADLYFYIEKKSVLPKKYSGIELHVESFEHATSRCESEFFNLDITKDLLPIADYYLCSGAMNILNRFETYLFIRRCFEASEKGFIFNMLKGEDQSLIYNYFLPSEIREYAKELGAKCKIVEGYLDGDFSVRFLKES